MSRQITVEETPEPIVRPAWLLDGNLFRLEGRMGAGDVDEWGYHWWKLTTILVKLVAIIGGRVCPTQLSLNASGAD